MNKKYFPIVPMIVFVVLGYFAWVRLLSLSHQNQVTSSNSGKVSVTASFYPLYYFASQIGGDKAAVRNLTPAGAEPHDYEPSTLDIATIEKSNLLVLNGGKLEAWGDKIKDSLQGSKVMIVIAGDSISNQQVAEDGQTIQDPHVWLSPKLAKIEVANIEQGFERADRANASSYQVNAKLLDDKLDQLDQAYKQGLSNCADKNIVTSHAAFGYLAKAYGLNQMPIAGLSPDAEPSSQQLATIATFAKQSNVHYIFFESLVSPKLSDTIANEIGAKTLVLDPIEGLSEDDIKQGKNYVTQMQMNLANLRTALQCQ